jgi:hypothetical protein
LLHVKAVTTDGQHVLLGGEVDKFSSQHSGANVTPEMLHEFLGDL